MELTRILALVYNHFICNIYMDVLISRLRNCGVGCRLLNAFYGCLLYAGDVVLLTLSVNAMGIMLDVYAKNLQLTLILGLNLIPVYR
jgi:hypothetical protein